MPCAQLRPEIDRFIKLWDGCENINKTISMIEEENNGKEMANHLRAQLKYDDCAWYEPISGIEWSTINN